MTELILLRDSQEFLRRVCSRRFELLGVTTGGESCTVLLVNGHARSTLLCLFLIWFERRPRGFAVQASNQSAHGGRCDDVQGFTEGTGSTSRRPDHGGIPRPRRRPLHEPARLTLAGWSAPR